VILLRLEEVGAPVGAGDGEEPTLTGIPAVAPTAAEAAAPDGAAAAAEQPAPVAQRTPRTPGPAAPRRRRLSMRRAGAVVAVLLVLALIVAGALLAMQSVYFIGTNQRGLVTLYQGVPFTLPGDVHLYSSRYVSGVSASTLTPHQRTTLLDHSLRSEAKAASLIRSLELDQLE
jgi:hypothetical protein